MKTKIEKVLRYLATGIFFVALALNVKFTLDSPYFLTGNELVAQTTGTGSDTTGTDTGSDGYKSNPIDKYVWKTVSFSLDADGKVIKSSIKWKRNTCTNCAKLCDASAFGVCTQDVLCPQSDPDPLL